MPTKELDWKQIENSKNIIKICGVKNFIVCLYPYTGEWVLAHKNSVSAKKAGENKRNLTAKEQFLLDVLF